MSKKSGGGLPRGLYGFFLFSLLTGLCQNSNSQEKPQYSNVSELDSVEVRGLADRKRVSGKRLLKAIETFNAQKSTYSPDGSMKFFVEDVLSADRPSSVSVVSLIVDGDRKPIELDSQKSFPPESLPLDVLENGDLVFNKKKNEVVFVARVRSPGLAAGEFRLGDLRLACRVHVAMGGDDNDSLAFKTLFLLHPDPCSSGFFTVLVPRKIQVASAAIFDAGRIIDLPIKYGNSFPVPWHDSAISNNAIVKIRYVGLVE